MPGVLLAADHLEVVEEHVLVRAVHVVNVQARVEPSTTRATPGSLVNEQGHAQDARQDDLPAALRPWPSKDQRLAAVARVPPERKPLGVAGRKKTCHTDTSSK